MKRIVLWLLSTISAVVLLFGYHTSTSGALTAAQGTVFSSSIQPGASTNTSGNTSGNGNSGSGGAGNGSGNGGGSTPKPTVVTGVTANTQWGPVEVQLTIDSGTITKVAVPVYPSGNSTDAQINSHALPILVQDTLDAQGANIHMVSGATVTSTGYVQSLQSALDRAGL